MKEVIKALVRLKRESPIVYGGKGGFKKLTVELHAGLSLEEIKRTSQRYNRYGVRLPEDYVKLLNFSNGVYFFEHADCQIYDLKEAFTLGIEEWKEKGHLCIGQFYEDTIYLKCDGSSRNIFVSEEGFSELRPMNMSLRAFLDASLCSGFSYFWLWGTDDYDLY